MFYLFTLLSIRVGVAVSAETGEASHQEREVFAEPGNANDIQEDLFNDIYDKATEVSKIPLNTVLLLACDVIYLFVKTLLNVPLGEINSSMFI